MSAAAATGTLHRTLQFWQATVGKKVVTVEGLASDPVGAKLQQAWIDEQVPQCGYCQSGMLMAGTALVRRFPRPSDENINEYMDNICACGTYPRVRRGIKKATGQA